MRAGAEVVFKADMKQDMAARVAKQQANDVTKADDNEQADHAQQASNPVKAEGVMQVG